MQFRVSSATLRATMHSHLRNRMPPTTKRKAANLPAEPNAARARLDDRMSELVMLLDSATYLLGGGRDAGRIVEVLMLQLADLRDGCSHRDWAALVTVAQHHPVKLLLLQDPLTARAHDRPRGTTDHGVLRDLFCRHPESAAEQAASTALGRAIFAYTSTCPTAAALRRWRACWRPLRGPVTGRARSKAAIATSTSALSTRPADAIPLPAVTLAQTGSCQSRDGPVIL